MSDSASILTAGMQEAYVKELIDGMILEVKKWDAPGREFVRIQLDRSMALAVANWILENLQDPT